MKYLALDIGLLGLVVEDLQVHLCLGLCVYQIRTGIHQVPVVFYSLWQVDCAKSVQKDHANVAVFGLHVGLVQ